MEWIKRYVVCANSESQDPESGYAVPFAKREDAEKYLEEHKDKMIQDGMLPESIHISTLLYKPYPVLDVCTLDNPTVVIDEEYLKFRNYGTIPFARKIIHLVENHK